MSYRREVVEKDKEKIGLTKPKRKKWEKKKENGKGINLVLRLISTHRDSLFGREIGTGG